MNKTFDRIFLARSRSTDSWRNEFFSDIAALLRTCIGCPCFHMCTSTIFIYIGSLDLYM